MTRVFICGPLRADTTERMDVNIKRATYVALKYWREGYNVYCPHMNSGSLHGLAPDKTFLAAALEELERSDIIVMLPGWRESKGSCVEYDRAIKLNKEILFEVEEDV